MGYDRTAICQQLGIPKFRLNNAIAEHLHTEWHEGKRAFDAANGPDSKPSRQFRDILDVPIPKYATPVDPKKQKASKWKHAVIYGDSHFPFHDQQALDVILGVIAAVRPNLVAHVGDATDCYTISRFGSDPSRMQSLQDDIDVTRTHLHQVAQLAPDAEKELLEGNHEDRLRKIIWNLQGAQRELPRLRVFQQAMTWPVLLGLDQIGWGFTPYHRQPLVGKIPRFLLKHGDVVRKWSGWSAKAEWEKYAKSGASGHTHRLGKFLHRNLDGSQAWFETGCSCTLSPEYVRNPDWHHGCLVVAYTDDWFQVEPVFIENGRAVWRGKEYAA